jgi:hypothetical protein
MFLARGGVKKRNYVEIHQHSVLLNKARFQRKLFNQSLTSWGFNQSLTDLGEGKYLTQSPSSLLDPLN